MNSCTAIDFLYELYPQYYSDHHFQFECNICIQIKYHLEILRCTFSVSESFDHKCSFLTEPQYSTYQYNDHYHDNKLLLILSEDIV
jgi:hypothetical protein